MSIRGYWRAAVILMPLLAAAGIAFFASGCAEGSLPRALGGAGVRAEGEAEKALFAEIDDAAGKDFDKDKIKAMVAVAKQSDLSPNAQVYLVYKSFKALDFDQSRVAVLKVLIRNPAFSPAAKKSIEKRMSEFMFDDARAQTRAELQRRGAPPP